MAKDEAPNIPAIKARYEAATGGPWEWKPANAPTMEYKGENHYDYDELSSDSGYVLFGVWHNDSTAGVDVSGADAVFIAHARTDIPQLVTALEEAQRLLRAASGWLPESNVPPAWHEPILKWRADVARILKGE